MSDNLNLLQIVYIYISIDTIPEISIDFKIREICVIINMYIIEENSYMRRKIYISKHFLLHYTLCLQSL